MLCGTNNISAWALASLCRIDEVQRKLLEIFHEEEFKIENIKCTKFRHHNQVSLEKFREIPDINIKNALRFNSIQFTTIRGWIKEVREIF